MLARQQQGGVTLVELMIGIAVLAILIGIGVPSFNLMIQNVQNRTAAESLLNGLQLARTEAVRRNTNVRFNLTDISGLVAWSVDCVTVTANCPAAIQTRSAGEGSTNARVAVSTVAIPTPPAAGQFATPLLPPTGLAAGIGVTFNGLGRVANNTDITRMDVTNNATPGARRMVVIIGTGGQIRMCDSSLALSTNPQGCS